jgi:hypothetical protein
MGRAITHMQIIKRNQKKNGLATAIVMFCLSILVLSAIIIVPPSLSFQSQTNGGSKYPTMSSNQRDLQPNNNTTTILGLPSSDKITELKLLADSLSDRLNKSAAILEITSTTRSKISPLF